MNASELSTRSTDQTHQAVRVLEEFSQSARLSFDRILATRALSEAVRSVPGEDWPTWSRRLVEVGESLNLRIRAFEARLGEVFAFPQQGIPIATCVQHEDGTLGWLIVKETRGRRFRVLALSGVGANDHTEQWLTVRSLRRRVGAQSKSELVRWVLGQAALACQAPGRLHVDARKNDNKATSGSPRPFSRLWGLLQPERKDLWVVLLFSVVVGLLAIASPVAVEALVNTVAFGRFLQPVIVLAILLFTFLAFAAAMRALIAFLVEVLQRRLFVRVVEDLAYRLPRVKQQAMDQVHGPELVNRFFDIVTIQKSTAALLLDGIAVVLQTVIGMAVLAFYHPFLLGFDIALLVLIAAIVFGLGRGAVKTAVKESKAKYAVGAWLQELSRHPTAFKLHAGAQFAIERADQLATHWLETRRNHFRILLRQILFALGLQAVAATVLLGLGGWLVILGELTLGQLVAAELIVMIIVGSFAKLGKHMESFYDLLASVDKLGRLFDLPTEAHDKLFHLADTSAARLNVHNVAYKYQDKAVIDGLTLAISPGETVALLGKSGAGKSTVIDLIAGIRQPAGGRIELDGIDLRELRPDSLREHLAMSRGPEIFAGSINDNVHLNRTHINALDVRLALETVGLLDEILQLPDGLATELQTNGAPLTSSQSARLMIARAIAGRPRLLLIDGTLDGLGDEVAEDTISALTQSNVPWTLVVATGREAIASKCDTSWQLGTKQEKRGV